MSPARPPQDQPAQPSAEAWLSDAELLGLTADAELRLGTLAVLADLVVWTAMGGLLVWGLIELLTGITR